MSTICCQSQHQPDLVQLEQGCQQKERERDRAQGYQLEDVDAWGNADIRQFQHSL
jgi:hypothetical protein